MRIVVIGGGVAGLCAGAALAPDAEVVVLEREDALGYHASGRSAAMFEENYGNAVVNALSRASHAGLKAADVRSLGDLVRLEISDMMKFRNFGKKSLAELEQLVADKNLTFGMDLSKYKLDED